MMELLPPSLILECVAASSSASLLSIGGTSSEEERRAGGPRSKQYKTKIMKKNKQNGLG
jgi:hypothetical protein